MPNLILINGAPGSGKSSLASAVAREKALTLALDVDVLKHALERWDEDAVRSGLQARRLAVALTREQLASGFDVVIGQYLPRTAFIEELEHVAHDCGAQFHEFVLDADAATLAARLSARRIRADRPEHDVNNRLVGPADAVRLAKSLEGLRTSRPKAVWVDAGGSLAETTGLILDLLDADG
ncbi:AAA family ATPase [Humibacter sp.]|jgi:predicted kinase|uniref:AAA family ATPase n=1 Tax=Humibacter sp. TaxID=1940291 RepID=UPI002C294747|nr:AAA family ATPase [Humibacter sp.]HVX08087.1 AAA family ATPase [Humibacter sp.]